MSGSSPVLIRRVAPNTKTLRQPRAKGIAIVELGVNDQGHVVSACVLRGMRSDFDKAVQAAALEWLWTPKLVKGQPVGVVMTVTFDTSSVAHAK